MKLSFEDILEHLELLGAEAPTSTGVFDNGSEAASFTIRVNRLREVLKKGRTAEVSLGAIGTAVFPGTTAGSRRTMFSTFRGHIKALAKAGGRRFSLEQPAVRNRDPEEVLCFFEGEPIPHSLEGPTNQGISKLEQGPELEKSRLTPDVVRIFVSFANKDREAAADLVRLLESTWGERAHRVKFWKFDEPANGGILVGDPNEESIRSAMADCPLGLLLLSPDYMASPFIKRVELPEYFPRKADKHPIPVNLRNSGPGTRHLPEGMKKDFIFARDGRSFEEMDTRSEKERFAMALNDHLEQLCVRRFPRDAAAVEEPLEIIPTLDRELAEHEGCLVKGMHRKEARLGDSGGEDSATGLESVPDLMAWAESERRACYFALLGEVGAGKTTTCLVFAKQQNAKAGPVKAYHFDMRYANYDGLLERTQKRPMLKDIMSAILRRANVPEKVTAEAYLKAVREKRAVLIFDGLDEILITLDPSEQDAFMQQLLSALPVEATRKPGAGKLLFACRTNFFRSSIAERGAFTLQGREGVDEAPGGKSLNRASFEVARILPFTEEQIREYFTANLPQLPFEKVWGLLESIHNLSELATRPYLLNLIRQQLPRLSQGVESGKTVRTVDLYSGFMEDWSQERNKFHNVMLPEDKLRLMASLAAWMWKEEAKTVSAAGLEQWLLKTLVKDPVWMAQYGHLLRPDKVSEILSDLRTASFVARWEGDVFRFAHTSIQEYFLAKHLAQALVEGDEAAWDMPMASAETLAFLGELLGTGSSTSSLTSLERLMSNSCLQAARMAFEYWLKAIEKGYPEPKPQWVNLAGADFSGRVIKGRSTQRPLNLRGANLSGAVLYQARLEFVDLVAANLDRMQARQALFIDVNAEQSVFTNVDVAGLKWRRGTLEGAKLLGTDLSTAELAEVRCIRRKANVTLRDKFSRSFPGHSGAVNACAIGPDGLWLISGSSDNTLKIWDAQTGAERLTLSGHASSVRACAISPDGCQLVSGSDDNTLKVWDAQRGIELLTLKGHVSYVAACAFSPDGRLLASGSNDNTLKVWDAKNGKEIVTLRGHSRGVYACAFSPDGQWVVSGAADKTLKIWDVQNGRTVRTLTGHIRPVKACAFSPNGQLLVSGSDDRNLKIWNTQSWEECFTLKGHLGSVTTCAFSPDGRWLISGSDDKTLKVWDVLACAVRVTIQGHLSWVRGCAFSPDNRWLVSGAADNTLKVWDALNGVERFTIQGHSDWVNACLFSPDGRWLVSAAYDSTLKVWSSHDGQGRLTFKGHTSYVSACALSPDGRLLASGAFDNTLKVWDFNNGQELRSLKGHSSWVRGCAFSPDGRQLISGSDDGTLKLWDVHAGVECHTFRGHSLPINTCAFSPDGCWVVSGSDDETLKVWDARKGQVRFTLMGHSNWVRCCAFSSDGRWLASGAVDKTLNVWDVQSGNRLLILEGHSSSVRTCAFSPDGSWLASGADDNTLKVWDTNSGRELLTLSGHSNGVRTCAFSPTGQWLVSGSFDGTLKVWNAKTGKCMWTGHHLPEHQSASISGDEQKVLHATPEAWRWLGWDCRDAEGRFVQRLPIEEFGPVPGIE